MRPFVDYYSENAISPVSQDIGDLERHFDRRDALYRALGVVPAMLADRSIIEFGPGSGFNSIYTSSLGPSRYLLVEGNPTGVSETRKRLDEHALEKNCEIRHALIEDFESDEHFDVALCEGTIPFQMDPGAFSRKVGSFCKPGGILIITCVSAISFMGEITRRLIASRLVSPEMTVVQKLDILRPFFASHLATLRNMSRPVDDWILDNIIQPLVGRTYAIDTAITDLAGEFEVYGASPHFIKDWRWYKDVWGPHKGYNERAKVQYLSNVANFLDYRIELPAHSDQTGQKMSSIANEIYLKMQAHERGELGAREAACAGVDELAAEVAGLSPATAGSLREAAAYVRTGTGSLRDFQSYFARGQQYLSFIRMPANRARGKDS